MKICGRCDKPIRDGEPYTKYEMEGATGAGCTVYRHDSHDCTPLPTQTGPVYR